MQFRYYVWFMLCVMCGACKGLKEPKLVQFTVREEPRRMLGSKAEYKYFNGRDTVKASTDALGHFSIDRKHLKNGVSFDNLKVEVERDTRSATIYTNPFSYSYDIYLARLESLPESERVADMHYHLSMRAHNTFGVKFYRRNEQPPSDFNWLMVDRKWKVWGPDGKWRKVEFDKLDSGQLRLFLGREWVWPAEGANNFKHFSEATFPHMVEGNIYLAFNAISPFEYGVCDDGVKRAVNAAIKSGAPIDWLKVIGGKDDGVTHWENFNREYQMITAQKTFSNNFEWSYLKIKDNRNEHLMDVPLVVNVVEGGHILQHRYFPHFINYALTDTASKEFKKHLFESIKKTAKKYSDDPLLKTLEKVEQKPNRRAHVIDSVLMGELMTNVDSLKKMDIYMIAIGHLSYNGMVGHAPALDVSKRPAFEAVISGIARRAYGIRVSNDQQYKKAFDGLFYRVPSVNKYGDSVINRLLDYEHGGRIIHIDLKHSDPLTRRHVLEAYREASTRLSKPLSPICSHCAVNGLSLDYTAPISNEYTLLGSALARKFYPFSMNLYNEEVETICARNGIIGLPLEERVLGGYINNKQEWRYTISGSNKTVESKPERMRRFKYIEKAVKYLALNDDPHYKNVESFYQEQIRQDYVTLGENSDSLLGLICEQYLSAEPFLQNVFHIVDIAMETKAQQKYDSIREIAKIRIQRKRYNTLSVRSDAKRSIDSKLEKMKVEDTANSMTAGQQENLAVQSVVDSMLQVHVHQTSFYRDVDRLAKEIRDSIYARNPVAWNRTRRTDAWKNICLGSDLDGLIDPINICPTASQYPIFKEKLKVFIPLFLSLRKDFEIRDKLLGDYQDLEYYFGDGFTVDRATQMLFYDNLKNFTIKNFIL